MYDANLVLQAATTKTATFQPTTGLDLGVGTPRRGLKARIEVTAAFGVTAGTVVTPTIDHSTDNTTFITHALGDPFTLTTSPGVAQEIFMNVWTDKRYVRLSMVMSGAASLSPSVAYEAQLGLAYP